MQAEIYFPLMEFNSSNDFGLFIKIESENPFLWTGMKDASAESRKKPTRC
jgi:hypothetical protein